MYYNEKKIPQHQFNLNCGSFLRSKTLFIVRLSEHRNTFVNNDYSLGAVIPSSIWLPLRNIVRAVS